ncbi:Hypothetical predicted protein [Podarcis lilfordi]|uniref:Uncharacterized protein n=1 Tax=Podarcis lilfordi TaxID=74358 RepID=A0AA35P351_9SAUR|nr:Hypothetical predicted protein [Podarcis lilfordi]
MVTYIHNPAAPRPHPEQPAAEKPPRPPPPPIPPASPTTAAAPFCKTGSGLLPPSPAALQTGRPIAKIGAAAGGQ